MLENIFIIRQYEKIKNEKSDKETKMKTIKKLKENPHKYLHDAFSYFEKTNNTFVDKILINSINWEIIKKRGKVVVDYFDKDYRFKNNDNHVGKLWTADVYINEDIDDLSLLKNG